MSGISVGATAAAQPAVEGMAIETIPVTTAQAGSRKIPIFLSGLISRATKCTSHLVYEITAAKPIAEQMAMMSAGFVIDLSNCWKAIMGFIEMSAMTKPEVSRTKRVS